MFAKLATKVATTSECPLEQLNQQSSCLPQNYSSAGYNFCVLSGKVDCSIISNYNFVIPSNPLPTSTPTTAPGVTNTPTVTGVPPTNSPSPSPTPPVGTPTLVPGGCYCANATFDRRSPPTQDNPNGCNFVGSGVTPPALYCDTFCNIHCQ